MAKKNPTPAAEATAKPIPWYDDADEIPRPGGADAASLARRQRRYRRVVWASVILLPLALIAVVVEAGHGIAKPVLRHSTAQVASPGETAAWQEMGKWLASKPSPLPGGRILSWDGATPVPALHLPKNATDRAKPGFSAEIDHFSLVAHGRAYSAGVEVGIVPGGGATAIAGPSLTQLPAPPANPASQSGPWPGVAASTSAPSAVTQAIDGWAQAYASGKGSALRLAVGDTNSSDHYIALSGAYSATPSVLWAAPVGKAKLDRMMVEISLSVIWDSQVTTSTTTTPSSGSGGPSTTMDLLVERASTAAPVVVAWGPAGSGPTLTPYQNAK